MGLDLRFEDIDHERVIEDMWHDQLHDLELLGLTPEKIYFQSSGHDRHFQVFREAIAAGRVYPCICSRTEIESELTQLQSAPHHKPRQYSGKCRGGVKALVSPHPTVAWRWRNETDGTGHHDPVVARTLAPEVKPPKESSEFQISYNFACSIDDFDFGYELVVRAWDLEPVAEEQWHIHEWLAQLLKREAKVRFFHTALITTDSGQRLSKRQKGITWKELENDGKNMLHVRSCFSKSIDLSAPLDVGRLPPGTSIGEAKKTLCLSDLGL